MKIVRRIFAIVSFCVAFETVVAQKSETVTITEPGVYKLEELFKVSDIVALVKIVAGDAENYPVAIYKTKVIQSFKGPEPHATVYLGPYVGLEIGEEYFVFLRNTAKPISPKTKPSAAYGTVSYAEIFNEGYTEMKASYSCVFRGNSSEEKCDDGVRVCTDYINLPRSLPAYPPEENNPPFGCRWVRRSLFVTYLEALSVKK